MSKFAVRGIEAPPFIGFGLYTIEVVPPLPPREYTEMKAILDDETPLLIDMVSMITRNPSQHDRRAILISADKVRNLSATAVRAHELSGYTLEEDGALTRPEDKSTPRTEAQFIYGTGSVDTAVFNTLIQRIGERLQELGHEIVPAEV